MKISRLKNASFVIALSLLVSGCLGGGGGGGGGSNTSDDGGGGAGPTTSLGISGSVSKSSDVGSLSALNRLSDMVSFSESANECANVDWTLKYVGGSGTVVSSGITDGEGEFEIESIPKGKEGVIEFGGTCSQRCLVKSGDQGINCNPAADAVLGAFEVGTGKSIFDSSFSNASLAKVGSAISQAAEGESAAVEAFNLAIASCAKVADLDEKKQCFKDAMDASPFSGQFKMLKAMATGWSAEAIYTFMADSAGYKIYIDQFIYTEFGKSLDAALSTDFVAKTREFVGKVVADQLNDGNAYAVKLSCRGGYNKTRGGGQFSYDPVMVNSSGVEVSADGEGKFPEGSKPSCANVEALKKNGISDVDPDEGGIGKSQVQKVIDAINSGSNNVIQLGSAPCETFIWDTADLFCVWTPNLEMTSKFKEVNRNDPEGDRGGYEPEKSISMISTFEELEESLQAAMTDGSMPSVAGQPCLRGGEDGPPVIGTAPVCRQWWSKFLLDNRKNFAGIMGLYMYLGNPGAYASGGSSKLSLDDIHKIFVSQKFLNTKLAAWAPMYSGRDATLTYTRLDGAKGERSRWLPPLLSYNASTDRFSLQNVFKWDPINGNTPLDEAQTLALMNSSSIPFKHSFGMFERIPNTEEIRQFIFGAGKHIPWNPSGTKYFYSPAVKQTGKPILCRMVDRFNGKPMEVQPNAKTKIECAPHTDSWYLTQADDSGSLVGSPAGYPYLLQQTGWMGDNEGSLFVLADRKTGMPIRPGEQEVYIKEFRLSNDGVCKTAQEKDSVINAKMTFGWGDDTRDEALKAYCLDMANYTNSNLIRFYDGGELEIKQKDPMSGQTWTWRVRQVGYNEEGSHTLNPVCAFVSSDLAKNPQTNRWNFSVSDATIDSTTGMITSLGTGVVEFGDCNNQVGGKTKYYLVQMRGSEQADRDDMQAFFMTSDGTGEFLQVVDWSSSMQSWEQALLKVTPAQIESNATEWSGKSVAPLEAPTYVSHAKVLNSKYSSKFDPYCDDTDQDGECNCFEGKSTSIKTAGTCSLLDETAEPTMSNAPYCMQCPGSAKMKAFFDAMGGKSGDDLKSVPALTFEDEFTGPENIASAKFDHTYMMTNQIWFNWDDAFRCTYKKTGENYYRKPDYPRGDGFYKNAQGCPNSSGEIEPIANHNYNPDPNQYPGSETGGGPVSLIKPLPMNNAYAIEKPETLMKLISYATKSVGQNVTLNRTEKVFTFDEALALISLRYALPAEIDVYMPDGSNKAVGASPMFEAVDLGQNRMDSSSAVLRGLTRPHLLSQ